EQTPDGWQQLVAAFDGALPFERIDLSQLPAAEQRQEVERRAAEAQATLNLTNGPALKLVHFDLGAGRPGRLLIVVHYLVTDGVSLRVLLEDIQSIYEQLAGGEAVRLNQKTTSYQYWARRLEEYAGSESLKRELDYWLAESRAQVAPLPTDGAAEDALNEEVSVRSVGVSLEVAETQSLLQEVPQAYHTQINEVLLAALALAAARWAGTTSLLVELEGHGREDLFTEADVSRTVGAFTTHTPVLLELGERADDLASALKSVKEQVRRVPRHGIGYGLLRYMSADAETRARLAALPRPEVRFNYLGQVDQLFTESQLFRPAHEAIGPAHSPRARRGHLLEINGMISEGRLQLEWNYNEHLQRRETVEHLAGLYMEELRALIAHCLSPESGDFTPSDFPLANLDDAQLDKLALILEESDVDKPGAHVAEAAQVASNGERAHQLSKVEEVLRQHPSVRNTVVVERAGGPGGGGGLVAYVELDPQHAARVKELEFSLFYFADDDTEAGSDKYRLLVEGAKFADRHGFKAVWTPERHFHEKAGLYPNPSVLSAALAMVTERVHLRAGSVALPLHNPLRVAEEWSVADNLSGGRVGVSVTSGWVPNDFAFFPERFAVKKEEMFRLLGEVQRLWRGEPVAARDGVGNDFEVRVFPRPVQAELPVWLTCSGGPEMFRKAGELGANVLTALLAQSVEEAAGKIKLYRDALAENGHDPASGHVTMMVHTFLGADPARVLERVRVPLTNYLRSHVSLIESYAKSMDIKVGLEREQWIEALVGFAFERYYRTASLIGTPQTCLPMIERLKAIGVDEVACLIDFGVETETVLASLEHLNALKELARPAPAARASTPSPGDAETDVLAGFLKERLPDHPTPSSFVFMNSLPVTPEGEVNRRVLLSSRES
ncbi:MAG: MupA/Atu3671 family FMN-dependent luciferase-like monooxygenase, partial [Pyrinomonadaceae bacterium]